MCYLLAPSEELFVKEHCNGVSSATCFSSYICKRLVYGSNCEAISLMVISQSQCLQFGSQRMPVIPFYFNSNREADLIGGQQAIVVGQSVRKSMAGY